jgi:uncharacterized membrane protein YgcG
MSDFYDRLELELAAAAERHVQHARRSPAERAMRFAAARRGRLALALAALAALVVAAVALTPGGDQAPRRSLDARTPPPPAPGAGPGAVIAEGSGPRGDWQLAAYSCPGAPDRRLLQVVVAGRPTGDRGRCASVRPGDPERELTVDSAYDRRIGATVVYGLASDRVDSVRVRVGRRSVRLPTRPAPAVAGGRASLPPDVRFYAADVPGDAEEKGATGLARGEEVACAPQPECDERGGARDSHADGGERGGGSGGGSSGGGDSGSAGGPKRDTPEARKTQPGRPVIVARGAGESSWRLFLSRCRPRPSQVMLTLHGGRQAWAGCGSIGGGDLFTAQAALAGQTGGVYYGLASTRVATVEVRLASRSVRATTQRPTAAQVEKGGLPNVLFWVVEAPGGGAVERVVARGADGGRL